MISRNKIRNFRWSVEHFNESLYASLVCLLTDLSPQSLESNLKVYTYPTLAKTRIEFNAFTKLHELIKDIYFRIIIGQINISSIRKKFDALKNLVNFENQN